MGRRFVGQLADGDSVEEIYLVGDKQLKANRQGNFFIQVELRDRTGVIVGRLWNATEQLFRQFDEGDFLQVKGKVQLFQGALQMILTQLIPVESEKIELSDFLPHTEHDIHKLLDRLRAPLWRMANHHLRALVECFFMDEAFVHGLCRAPAGIRNHHAYIGGLLEHLVSLIEAADRILGGSPPLHPEVDRDLVLVGVFLHDIGKIRELSYDRAFTYSDEGQLIGHIVIGLEMLNEKLPRVEELTGEPFPRELQLRLKHMILSHHGSYEFGSPKLPMTPEAIALAQLDNFDAKVHSFTREIRDDRNLTSAWTPFNQALQRKLYKGPVEDSKPMYSPIPRESEE